MTTGIEIIVNEDRPGFADYTFKKGKRKVYLFELTDRNMFDSTKVYYAVYSPSLCVYKYFEALMTAQIYASELLDEPCWAPQQGPSFPPATINTVLKPIWRNW